MGPDFIYDACFPGALRRRNAVEMYRSTFEMNIRKAIRPFGMGWYVRCATKSPHFPISTPIRSPASHSSSSPSLKPLKMISASLARRLLMLKPFDDKTRVRYVKTDPISFLIAWGLSPAFFNTVDQARRSDSLHIASLIALIWSGGKASFACSAELDKVWGSREGRLVPEGLPDMDSISTSVVVIVGVDQTASFRLHNATWDSAEWCQWLNAIDPTGFGASREKYITTAQPVLGLSSYQITRIWRGFQTFEHVQHWNIQM